MSLKTKLILGASVLAAIGIGIGLELHRLHRRILEELVAIRQQGEQSFIVKSKNMWTVSQ